MKISEVAARSGVPTTTLRYYENFGLLIPARSRNGYRDYNGSHLEQLEFINAAKQLGLELPEIRQLLELAETGTCTDVKITLKPLLTDQLTDVERQLGSLNRLRMYLRQAFEHVATCPDSNERCRSDCAFQVLAKTAKEEDRRERWNALLAHGTFIHHGDELRIILPADQASEAVVLIQAEHASDPSARFRITVDATRCTIFGPARLLEDAGPGPAPSAGSEPVTSL